MSDIQARIRIGDGGVEGFNQFTMSPGYTTNEDTPYEMQQAPITNLTGQDQDATYHDSDDGPPEIINLEENNRVWRFTLKVDAGSKTGNLNALSTLKRHVSGKQSTAYQSYRNGSQEPVWFDIRLDSGSLWTSFRIMRGVVDDGQSFYTTAADINDKAIGCLVVLTCVPAGRGEAIELRNDLPSSPHMIEDSDGDGLADGLSLLGTPSVSISTSPSNTLTGGHAQLFITDSTSNEGIISSTITTSSSTDAVAKILVTAGAGNDVLTMSLRDGVTILSRVEFDEANPSGYSKTHQGAGRIWYEYHLSGTGASFVLYVNRTAASATQSSTYLVDFLYLQTGTDIVPDGWCSSSSLKNRYDPTNTSAATRQQINYLDVWGVPGDMPAETSVRFDGDGEYKQPVITVGQSTGGINDPASSIFSIEGELFQGSLGEFSNVTDATRIGGAYLRNTNSGTTEITATVAGAISNIGGFTGWNDLFTKPHRVYAVARSGRADSSISFVFGDGGEFGGGFTAADTWELVDCGIYNPPFLDPSFQYSRDLLLYSTATATTTIDIDKIYFVPVDKFTIYEWDYAISSPNLYFDSTLNIVQISAFSYPFKGILPKFTPAITNRLIFMVAYDDDSHFISDTFNVGLSITPMASHLLGTSDTLTPSHLPA